jgi:biopolymer transport protein ExbD
MLVHLNIKAIVMAEVNVKSQTQSRGSLVSKRHVHSTKVDLTPMVDLGFLLITFFIFTTAMNQPKVMNLFMPDDKGDPMPIKESGALTLMPISNAMLYYYEGKLGSSNMMEIELKEIRNLILNKKVNTKEKDLFVVIKPTDFSTYGDLLKVLDEMKINDVKRYSIADISSTELRMMKIN